MVLGKYILKISSLKYEISKPQKMEDALVDQTIIKNKQGSIKENQKHFSKDNFTKKTSVIALLTLFVRYALSWQITLKWKTKGQTMTSKGQKEEKTILQVV